MAIGETDLEVPASIEIAKYTLLSADLILAIGTITGLLAQARTPAAIRGVQFALPAYCG
jgi:hypothetical protein